MREDDELHIDAIATASATTSGAVAVEMPPSFLGSIDVDSVQVTFSQERFDQLVEQARAIRVERRQAEMIANEARQRLEGLRIMEGDVMRTLQDLVRSQVGYEQFESDGSRRF